MSSGSGVGVVKLADNEPLDPSTPAPQHPTGKGGRDVFVFDSKLNAQGNVDNITEFAQSVSTRSS